MTQADLLIRTAGCGLATLGRARCVPPAPHPRARMRPAHCAQPAACGPAEAHPARPCVLCPPPRLLCRWVCRKSTERVCKGPPAAEGEEFLTAKKKAKIKELVGKYVERRGELMAQDTEEQQ